MKIIKNLNLILCLIILAVFIKLPAVSLDRSQAAEKEYLLKHGHSAEIARIVELQKSRIEPGKKEIKNICSKKQKFFRNILFERDITMPLNYFGHNKVKTVESH